MMFVRGTVIGRCSSSSSDSHATEEKFSEDAAISQPKFMIPGLAEKTNVGKIRNSMLKLLLHILSYLYFVTVEGMGF